MADQRPQAGVGPMPPFHVFREFLDAEEHAALIGWTLQREAQVSPATLGRENRVDEQLRKAAVSKDLGRFADIFGVRVRAMAAAMFQHTGTRPFDIDKLELELAVHNDGAHFAPHVDLPIGGNRQALREAGQITTERLLSGVYYFYDEPKGFSGGQLRMHRFGGSGGTEDVLDIEPEQNSFVIFPSWARHEVVRVNCPTKRFEHSRFAVNCWLRRRIQ